MSNTIALGSDFVFRLNDITHWFASWEVSISSAFKYADTLDWGRVKIAQTNTARLALKGYQLVMPETGYGSFKLIQAAQITGAAPTFLSWMNKSNESQLDAAFLQEFPLGAWWFTESRGGLTSGSDPMDWGATLECEGREKPIDYGTVAQPRKSPPQPVWTGPTEEIEGPPLLGGGPIIP